MAQGHYYPDSGLVTVRCHGSKFASIQKQTRRS